MTVANGQPAEPASVQAAIEAEDKTFHRQIAEIFHDAGIRSGDESVRVVAERWPEIFAGPRDAVKDVEAEREAGG